MKFLLTGDWHLREDTPTCRVDDFQQTQWAKLNEVWTIAEEYSCTAILLAGDVTDRPRPSIALLYRIISELRKAPCDIYSIAGNHDLPGHALSALPQSAYGILAHLGLLRHIGTPVRFEAQIGTDVLVSGTSWGVPCADSHHTAYPGWRKIAVIHEMVLARPGGYIEGAAAAQKATDLGGFDFVLAGHNHTPFYFPKRKGRAGILSPGPLTRQNAAEIDRTPSVYVLDTETMELTTVPLTVVPGACSRQHLDAVTAKDERISRFVDSLEQSQVISLDFRENLMRALEQKTVGEATRTMGATVLQGGHYEFGTAAACVEKGLGQSDDLIRSSGGGEGGNPEHAPGSGVPRRRRG